MTGQLIMGPMVPELVAAMHDAEQAEEPVRTAALLRIARVLTKFDQADAESLLDHGLALLAELPDKDRSSMAPQAVCLAACVAPNRAFALHAVTDDTLGSGKFLFDMLRHGHVREAVEYLTRWSGDGQFPYAAASETMSYTKQDDARREILRSALRAWRRRTDRTWHAVDPLLPLLRHQWRLLPAEEARDEIAHVVRVIREQPDGRLRGSFGSHRGSVTFSSQRACLLFNLLGPLRQLDPGLADAMINENPELARAAALYPFGPDTPSDRPVEPLSAEALAQWKRDWTGFVLDQKFFRMDDEKGSDFKDSFAHALRAFDRDANPKRPNSEPRECWPSAEDFRTILYAAGKHDPASGARLLDRIPDPALRLFAQIEFAAGVAGLDQIGGIVRESLASGSSRERPMAADAS